MPGGSTMSTFSVTSAVIYGVEAIPVTVEVSPSQGLPGYTLVGMADSTVLESRYRVQCALDAAGFENPREHVTINLAPAELRKTGTGFDLPIAVAILAATGQISPAGLDGCLFVGELGLTGEVCPVRGAVAHVLLAQREHMTFVSAPGCVYSDGVDCPCLSLSSLGRMRAGVGSLPAAAPSRVDRTPERVDDEERLDFADVYDQEVAKRALVIAAAGKHGLLMVGPPGAGKTMLARRIPTILPELDDAARIESMLVHSVAGQPTDDVEHGRPPFRAPHHTISSAGLVGGGRPVIPGEVSLAHRGVLFLDELPEFANNVLQVLRQPLEEHIIRIARAEGSYVFPCDFMLVAAANPCPCGHLGDPGRACTCAPARVEAYQARMGGPLADRIDIHIDIARPASRTVIKGEEGLSSRQMADMVRDAREFAEHRRSKAKEPHGVTGSFEDEARAAFEMIATRLVMGGRSIARAARVARTIADLEHHELVTRDDIVEACTYRGRAHG